MWIFEKTFLTSDRVCLMTAWKNKTWINKIKCGEFFLAILLLCEAKTKTRWPMTPFSIQKIFSCNNFSTVKTCFYKNGFYLFFLNSFFLNFYSFVPHFFLARGEVSDIKKKQYLHQPHWGCFSRIEGVREEQKAILKKKLRLKTDNWISKHLSIKIYKIIKIFF